MNNKFKIAVIGGGIAGSVIAEQLSTFDVKVSLFEERTSIVSGPPMCHLHTGGNLYRELSNENCIDLLTQSLKTQKYLEYAINSRPTIITIPTEDDGTPNTLIDRLELLKEEYCKIVFKDSTLALLGEPLNYYSTYSYDDCLKLALGNNQFNSNLSSIYSTFKIMDLSRLKFPIFSVKEFGINQFRISALLNYILLNRKNCTLKLSTSVTDIKKHLNTFSITCKKHDSKCKELEHFDYVINACGYKSALTDSMLGIFKNRILEFKASYLAFWEQKHKMPELIFHGKRSTVNGMGQLTPYCDGLFQIHCMCEGISLFKNGRTVSSKELFEIYPDSFLLNYENFENNTTEIKKLTIESIKFISKYIPSFSNAVFAGKPFYGIQQIPGKNPCLRTADVCFSIDGYATVEIVKISSAIQAAENIINKLKTEGHITSNNPLLTTNVTEKLSLKERKSLDIKAMNISKKRGYPSVIAKRYDI